MNFDKNSLNRSHSESDLYICQFDHLSLSVSSHNLTKGFSKNSYSPIVRRVYVEEIIPSENNFLRMRRTNVTEVFEGVSCSPKRATIEEEISQHCTSEEVPMEIDSSCSERYPKIVSIDKYNKPLPEEPIVLDERYEIKPNVPEVRKRRVIHINPVKKKRSQYKWLSLFILPIISYVVYSFVIKTNIFVNTDNQVKNIETDLTDNVHGHRLLVKSIVNMLENRNNWVDKIQVIVFVGSQGVGKTFVANLIKKHFPSNLVHEIYGSQLYYETEKQQIVNGIKTCCLNLIIIDDLMLNDNIELYAFIHSLPKDSFILLIAIYNIHYRDDNMNTVIKHEDVIKIRDNFDISAIKNYELLVFEDFTHAQIKDWLKKQLHLKKKLIHAEEQILQNVLNAHNFKHGLKGLHSKLILELGENSK